MQPTFTFVQLKKFYTIYFKLFSSLLFLLLASAGISVGQGTGSTVVGFEVDASFKSGYTPPFWKTTAPNQNYFGGIGDDWSKGTTGNAVLKQLNNVSVPGLTADRTALWQVDGNWGTNLPPDLSVFGGTSNKNSDAIGAGQDPYAIDEGSGGPQKNDITNVFLHARRNAANNNLWLFFGAETRSTNGNSYLDFEYNQAGVTTDGGFMTGLGPLNGRTIDDILLVINYTQGGKTPIVGIRKWLASGTWSDELTLPAGSAFMTTNTLAVDAVAPMKAFTGDGAPSNTSSAFQFVEGAINVSALGLAGLEQCTPNATVTVKTRASASYTSELKDWDVLRFPLTPASAALVNSITPQCETVPGPTVFTVTGTYDNGTPAWSTTAGTLSNEVFNAGVASATLSLAAGTTSAIVTLSTTSSNPNCPPATSSKTATVYPRPDVDQPGNQLICNGTLTTAISFTGTGATSYNWTNDNIAIGLAASGTGDIAAFSGTNSGSSPIVATITVTPRNTVGSLNCDGAAKSFTITVNPTPAVDQPGNQEICKGTSTTAIVFAGAGATSFTWTNDNTSIGLDASGTGNIAAFIGTTGASSSTATITVTPHFTGGGLTCDGPSKTFTIKVNPDAAPPQVTFIPPTCSTFAFSVQVNNPQPGSTYKLTQLDGNEVTLPPGPDGYVSGDLIFTGLHIGQGYKVVSTTSGGCKSNPEMCPINFDDLVSDPGIAVTSKASQKVEVSTLPSVSAAPNPFSDKIRFSIRVPQAGKGSLDLFNLQGQKLQSVFQGNMSKGEVRTIDYNVPYSQRSNLVYIFRIGDQKVSGKLIGIK
ncbi:MAG: hypothetical protein V4717_10100 [Bacteroidota bacterium]